MGFLSSDNATASLRKTYDHKIPTPSVRTAVSLHCGVPLGSENTDVSVPNSPTHLVGDSNERWGMDPVFV